MASRRTLIEGLKELDANIDPDLAEDFIQARKPRQPAKPSATPAAAIPPSSVEERAALPPLPQSVVTATQVTASPLMGAGRVPVGARVRVDLATALKRASLERQLHGREPFAVQEILEAAIELWLLKNGHPLM